MKLAPVLHALRARGVRQRVVHTGQHHERETADALLRDLRLPAPDVDLEAGSGSRQEQTARVMAGVCRCLEDRRPDALLVYGDSDCVMAATVAASRSGVPVGHVEAGLRSGGLNSAREANRILTDRLARWHFTHSADADANLLAEGRHGSSIQRVGNVMIDTLAALLPLTQPWPMLEMFGLTSASGPKPFALVTLHTPANVDDPRRLDRLLEALTDVAAHVPVIFPVHPRTRARMRDQQLQFSGLLLTEPLTYLQFLGLLRHSAVVITDSGGIQEETTYLGIPCLTVRDNTDRPVTVHVGTNTVVGPDLGRLRPLVCDVLGGRGKRGVIPPMWDGKAGERIADCLAGRHH